MPRAKPANNAEAASQTMEAPAVHTAPKGKRTVTVACKFATGIVLQLCRKVDYVEETQAGGRINRVRYDKVGDAITVRGPAAPNGQIPKGYRRPEVEGGFALTHGVDADFFEEWMRQNADLPLVKGGFIFAHASRDHAIGQAQDKADLLTGYEPLVPDQDPRAPKPLRGDGVSPIQTAEEGRRAA